MLMVVVAGALGCAVDVDQPLFGESNPQTASESQSMATEGESNGDSTTDDPSDPSNDGTDPTSDPDTTTSDSPPPGCGNGQLDDGEDCDGNLFAVTCEDFGFDGGELTCGPNCNANTTACFGCGNGMLEVGEECDGNDFGGATCQSVGDYVGGQLQCNNDCELVLDGCIEPHCGDGIVNLDEECDGNAFGGKTCQTEGWDQGQLSCTNDCTIDTSNCSFCAGAFEDCSNMPCCSPMAICIPDENICFGF